MSKQLGHSLSSAYASQCIKLTYQSLCGSNSDKTGTSSLLLLSSSSAKRDLSQNQRMSDDAITLTQSSSEDKDGSGSLIPLISIWDSPFINRKGTRGTPDEIWECLHCNRSFSKHNATKALWHAAKKSGQNIQVCRGKVSDVMKTKYLDLYQRKAVSFLAKKKRRQDLDNSIHDRNSKAAEAVSSKRSRNSSSVNVSNPPNEGELIPQHILAPAAFGGSTQSLVQMRLNTRSSTPDGIGITSPGSHFENLLTVTISDFIHANGLPFRVAECPRLKQIIKYAKHVNCDYNPPNREAVRTELLDTNYEQYREDNMHRLLTDADIYGISLFGDGATIHKMPLVNLLASGVNNPSAVLEIFDCTDHLSDGNCKDASALCRMFLPRMNKVDPDHKLFDAIFFDGAGNVQLSGEFLSHHYPRVTVMHGAEHVMSLFFKDLAKLPPVKKIINLYRLIYHFLGSGSHHGPYTIFQKHAKQYNDGRSIGLIQPSDVRMAGYFIALLRFCCLYPAVVSSLNSIEMKEYLKNTKGTRICILRQKWQ